MPKQTDTIFLRLPAELLLKDTLVKMAADQKARGNKHLDSYNQLGGVILLTFLKTAAFCRANPEIDPYKMMGVNFAKLYTELFREDQTNGPAASV